MPDFVNEFVDVTRASVRATPMLVLATANDNADNLQTAIDNLHRNGGGFLHFPPGRYYIGRRPTGTIAFPNLSVEDGDIVVYEDVTLSFSPGAVLVPISSSVGALPRPVSVRRPEDQDWYFFEDDLVRIEIHGAIQSRRTKIFDIFTASDATVGSASSADAGLVLLSGTQVSEVYPELSGAHISLYPLELRCSRALHPS